jgi:AbrB family looped-hinge helix DNA binding protein
MIWWDPHLTAPEIARLKIDSKGRILLPPALRDELDLEPGDSVSIKHTRSGLVVSPAKKAGKEDTMSKFQAMLEAPPSRYGKPENWSPSRMKKIWEPKTRAR